MKKLFIVRTRWQYYVANIGGLVLLFGLLSWLVIRIILHGVDLSSVTFWLMLVLMVIAPFAIISFFSSMKEVEVTVDGMTISYIFQKHKNRISFSEISEIQFQQNKTSEQKKSRGMRDTFKLVLTDGRAFEFERAQFDKYAELKNICLKKVPVKR